MKENYFALRKEENSVFFGRDELSKSTINKFKKSDNKKDHEFVNLILRLKNKNELIEKDVVFWQEPFLRNKTREID